MVRDQAKSLTELTTGKTFVYLAGYGKGGTPLRGPFTSEADLKKLLEETARNGQFPGGDQGPWSWLAFELLIGAEWVRPALTKIILTCGARTGPTSRHSATWCARHRRERSFRYRPRRSSIYQVLYGPAIS